MDEGDDEHEPAQVQVQRIMARYDLLKRFVPAIWIVAAWVPLQAVYPIAKVLAGKHTDVAVTLSVSVAVSLALAGGYVSLVRKLKAQTVELLRLRQRCSKLEGQLEAH